LCEEQTFKKSSALFLPLFGKFGENLAADVMGRRNFCGATFVFGRRYFCQLATQVSGPFNKVAKNLPD
jgi:hypothetical protein